MAVFTFLILFGILIHSNILGPVSAKPIQGASLNQVPTSVRNSYSNDTQLLTKLILSQPSGPDLGLRSAREPFSTTEPFNTESKLPESHVQAADIARTCTTSVIRRTHPCNNYREFCTRKYSNITEIASHNSAFLRRNNVFSNQLVPIIGQLNDGVRMIQGEVHYVNNSLYACHTECRYLNVGTFESVLVTIKRWLDANPYEVLTLLIVNSNFVDVENFTIPFRRSGILEYVYLPTKTPLTLSDWPTLGEMISSGQRLVTMMDYEVDDKRVPYILDEFSNMWETPFSPTNISFPCWPQRPPDLSKADAHQRMYMANHDLNVQLPALSRSALLSGSAVVPAFWRQQLLNANVLERGSLLMMAKTCLSDWGRPPKFLLVDFYNIGNGSVFEVAAQMNGVKYNRPCCSAMIGKASGRRLHVDAIFISILTLLTVDLGGQCLTIPTFSFIISLFS